VEDRLQGVGVGAFGGELEEAAAHDPTARRDARVTQDLLGTGDDVGLVEQHALQRGVRAKKCGQEHAAAAADVNDGAEAREVIALEGGRVREAGHGRHRTVEDRALLRMIGAVGPDVDAVHDAERVLAAANAVQEVPPRLPVRRAADEGRPAGERALRVGSQAVADVRQ